MSGLAMRYELDVSALDAQLDALFARGGNLKEPLKDIGLDMVAVTLRAFELQRSPAGEAWLPSAAAKAEGRQTLIKTRNLRDSFSYVVGETGVVYGTNVSYAAPLQTGFSFVHHALAANAIADETGYGGGLADALITVPAREFVGYDDAAIRRWEGTLADYLASSPGAA